MGGIDNPTSTHFVDSARAGGEGKGAMWKFMLSAGGAAMR